MKKILCIEDAAEYQTLIRSALGGFDILMCGTLADARTQITRGGTTFDLILLDVSLPDGNGIEFLTELKVLQEKVPVLILSYHGDPIHKVAAFGAGVDDYVCKPFEPLELRARIEARIRKATELDDEASRIRVGDLLIDRNRMQVSLAHDTTHPIILTPHEFKILFLLSRRIDVVFSRQQIIDEVWGVATYLTDRAVDAHISRLRQKIKESQVQISTVVGIGYKLFLKPAAEAHP